MATKQTSTLDGLASEAIRQGADSIEIEDKDGYEEVYFIRADFETPSAQATALRFVVRLRPMRNQT